MKFTCDKDILSGALDQALRVVSSKSTQDILRGFLIETEDGGIKVTANNLENAVMISVPADVTQAGSVVLDARLFSDITRRLQGVELAFDSGQDGQAAITCLLSEYVIPTMPAERFPAVPKVEGLRSVSIPQAALRSMLEKTTFAVSLNETKVIHTGVLFDCEPGLLTLVALDGYRLALARGQAECDDTFRFVTPAPPLRLLEKTLADTGEDTVNIRVSPQYVLFETPSATHVSRLIEGEFLKYKNSIPAENVFKAKANVKDIIRCTENISLLIDEKIKTPIRMKFDNNTLDVHCETVRGKGFERVSLEECGQLEIGFNHRYMLDALRHIPHEDTRIECNGHIAPMLLLPPEGDDYLFMVLPVRLKND
jgi:DNA polymerase-3 subunit beta